MDPETLSDLLHEMATSASKNPRRPSLIETLPLLVARPSQGERAVTVKTGTEELLEYRQSPEDPQKARALADVLLARAEADPAFADELQAWWASALYSIGQVDPTGVLRREIGNPIYFGGGSREVSSAIGSLNPTVSARTFREFRQSRVTEALGVLRIEIHGSWSVADLIQLLGRLDEGYKAAAALESLARRPSESKPRQGQRSASLSADDLLQTVTAFDLAGGLRLGSLSYGSPGFIEVIGALNPLKTVKDGITENREINLKRDEARRLDEREREQQANQYEERMTRESRASERQQQDYALERARLQLQAEQVRFTMMSDLIDRLPTDEQSLVAAQLLQKLMGATEAIANDARVDEVRILDVTIASASIDRAPEQG